MSIFDAGFVLWGYFLLYPLFIVAYYIWMFAVSRSERRRAEFAKAQEKTL